MTPRPIVIEKDMGITHAEFLRLLPRALESDAFEVDGARVRFQPGSGGRLDIELGPEDERRIALIRIATTPVRLIFTDIADLEREAMLERFDRAYQRGGG